MQIERPVLYVKGVTAGYGKGGAVLFNVTLLVREEIVAVIGANGAGKTTTMRMIMGQISICSGAVEFLGDDISKLPTWARTKMGIALCPEGRHVFGNLTISENLRLGAYNVRDRNIYRQRLEWVYALFPKLRERERQSAGSLSGGEQQMLALGRALMSSPKLLLLDEPSLGLAPNLALDVFKTFHEIHWQGTSILLVEQNVALALDVADRAYVMERGYIILEGTSEELLSNPNVRKAYLGVA